MELPDTRIFIYFADTGGGHGSVANAIEAGIRSVMEKEQIAKIFICKEPIIEKSHPFSRGLTSVYNYLARHHTTWIKYYAWLLHLLKPEAYYWLYRPFIQKILKEQKPSLIVSVHPMIAYCVTRAVCELHLNSVVKVAVVVTDPNERLWRAWACEKADVIIVPNEVVCKRLLDWNISANRIQVLGMPVHPKFLSPPVMSRDEFLKKLGLLADVFTVCINSGWAGNAHLLDTYRALTKCSRPLQVIFLAGHNQQLYKAALHTAGKTSIPTVVLPFDDQMSDLMNAVDVMVTKAGGLTTYEALARRLPLILDKTIEPMPQEASTLKMLVEANVAKELNHPDDIVDIIDAMKSFKQTKILLPEQYQLNLTDHAIFDIVKCLLHMVNLQIHT